MSWGTCYTASNSIHYDKPPIMMDGRNYSSWQPEAVINKKIQTTENIKSNWHYRQFLQENGRKIMKYNKEGYSYYLGIDPKITVDNEMPNGNVPFKYLSLHDSRKPQYGYADSDLKNPYLTKEQLQSRIISPSINLNSLN